MIRTACRCSFLGAFGTAVAVVVAVSAVAVLVKISYEYRLAKQLLLYLLE
jgi:hypothetical protein